MYELTCSGFEEFSSAIQGADSRVMLAGPEASDWWIRGVELPRLGVQLAQEGAANIFEGASWPTAVNLLIALDGAAFSLNGETFRKRHDRGPGTGPGVYDAGSGQERVGVDQRS